MKAKYAGAPLAIVLAGVSGLSGGLCPSGALAQSQTQSPSAKRSATEVIIHAQARQKPVDTPPALALYAAPPRIRLIGLSPSGDQVAFLTRADNMNLLVIYRFADKHQSFVKLQDGEVSNLSWADEGHVMLADSRSGLRGTCGGGTHKQDNQSTIEAVQSVTQAATQQATTGDTMGQQSLDQSAAQTDLDANTPPSCTFFGVHEEDAVTLIDIAKSTGTDLGAHFGDAVGMPLGLPQVVTIDGRRQLMGAFMEMRAMGVGEQPAQRVYLWQVDPVTGRTKLIDDGGGDPDRENRYVDDWLFDKSGALRARAVFEFRSEDFRIEVKDGAKWRPVLKRHIDKSDRTFAPYLVGLAEDGRSIVILDSETHGNDLKGAARHFHYYTLAPDGTVSAPLDQGDASQNKPIFDPGTGRLAGFSQSAEETTYRVSDPKLAHLYDLAKNASAADSVKVVSVADDPHRMLIHVAGRDDTGAYYLVDFAAGTSVALGEDYPDVPTDWIASQEEYSYRAADGTEISGLLTLPTKPEAHNLPLVVLPHDGPEGHDEAGFNWLAQALASRGYLVLQPNYRGSDGHGIDFMSAGFGEWNGKMLTDMSDGVQDLVRQGLADPGRVCYVGIGYGGYAALKAATRAETRCAVSINGISDVAGYVSWKNANSTQPDTDDFAGLIPDPRVPRGFGPDPNSRQTLASYVGHAANDSISAGDIRAPVLLIHADADPIVPAGQSQRLKNALQEAGHPATYVALNDRSHDIGTEAARVSVLQAVTDFLAKQNPARN
jgi:dipeptidyl aminopeptidase/acylaminoacyl peptidase